MKFLAIGLTLALLSIPATAATVFPYRYQTESLPNGLRVIFVPMPSGGLVSYWSVVRTGSRDEIEPGRSGYAHFFEHMMFRGTDKYPGPVYDRIVNGIGAHSNAFTTDDFTAFHMTFAKEDLAKVIELEADRFQNLHYDKQAFQTEAGAVYGEYRKDQTEPEFTLEEQLRNVAFDKHTYKHTTMGFEADVKSMPQGFEYSMSFFRRFYRPENVVLLVVGDFDQKATMKLIQQNYGPWKPGYTAAKIVPEPPQKTERHAEVLHPGKTQPILDLAYRGDGFDPKNRDYVAARLFADLAFGPTSDAYKKLVLDQQTAETIFCSVPMNRDAYLFEVTAIVKRAEDIAAAQKVLEETIVRFQTKPVDAGQLARVKRHAKYDFLMQLDAPLKTAQAVVPFISATGQIAAIDDLFMQSEKVTAEDIQRAAIKYFVPEQRTVIVLKGAAK